MLRPPYDIVTPNTSPDFSVDTKTGSRDLSDEEIVVAYHERTKHHYHRYAASLGYLDWAKQPDPFRRYDGAPLVSLPLPEEGRGASVLAALCSRHRGAGSAFGRLHLTLPAIRTLAHSLETVRGSHMASARQSVEREPPPDGGIRALAVRGQLSTTVPAYTTMHRRSTVSSFERTLIPRSGRP